MQIHERLPTIGFVMAGYVAEQDIFSRLITLGEQANGTNGAVAACLVRRGRRGEKIIAEAISKSGDGLHVVIHAEHNLLGLLDQNRIMIRPSDTLYSTLEPCSGRWDSSRGIQDCTGMIIAAGVKHVVFAESDPNQSILTQRRFQEAGVQVRQTGDMTIRERASNLFRRKVTAYCL